MTLRKKVVLLFLLAMGLLSAATYAVSYVVITRHFERVEEQIVRANLVRISNAVRHQIDQLDSTARDYATWDSPHALLRNRHGDYLIPGISDGTFNRREIDLYLIFDREGKVAFCRDFGGGETVCEKRSELTRLARAVRRFTGERSDRAANGLLLVGGRPLLISMQPIFRNNTLWPSSGTLVLACWMDEQQVQKIGKMLALPMTAVVASTSEIRRAPSRDQWSYETQWLEPMGSDTLTGFVRIPDLQGGPGMVLATDFHRDLLQQGRMAQRWLFIEILVVALLMTMAAFLVLHRIVLARIGRLSAAAALISSTGDLSQRVVVSGNDEITALESSFNSMLQDLEVSRRELLVAHEALEYHASHDDLTGVLSRAALMGRLRTEMTRARREETSIAVMLMDLDHFKHVNDTYGHAAGDDVLMEVMQSVKQTIRPYDVVGRYGGEEFLVIIPGAGEPDAMLVAERVRGNIEKTRTTPPVTVSIGVTLANGTEEERQLFVAADTALYRAKRAGRNRVEFCPSQQESVNFHGQTTAIDQEKFSHA